MYLKTYHMIIQYFDIICCLFQDRFWKIKTGSKGAISFNQHHDFVLSFLYQQTVLRSIFKLIIFSMIASYIPQTNKKKFRKSASLFSSIHKKNVTSKIYIGSGDEINPLNRGPPAMAQKKPTRKTLEFLKNQRRSDYGISFPSQRPAKKPFQGLGSKISRQKSLEYPKQQQAKSLQYIKIVNSFRQVPENAKYAQKNMKRGKNNFESFFQQNRSQYNCINKYRRSKISSQDQYMRNSAFVEYYNNQQIELYKEKLEKSEKKIKEVQKMAEEEKKKSKRMKQIYEQKINELNSRKKQNERVLGHIYSYENQKDFVIPDSVIVEQSIEFSAVEERPERDSGSREYLDLLSQLR